ncbi:E3 ubiquitin-protein ligase [Nymphaea thermarum]|nr:E3 ubiquitin-protein ligase [Nymphaea thermarum]
MEEALEMADADRRRGRTMDLNLHLGFHSLPQLGSHGGPVFATLQGDDYTGHETSEYLPENAEATLPVPAHQHWRDMNRTAVAHASNNANMGSDLVNGSAEYRGIVSEEADVVFIDPVDPGEAENLPSHIDKSNERPKLQLEITKDEEKNPNANFECNICFEFAKEPVVTSCGHLFCWPCLYQWLYIHSCTKECPVCKGLVTDSNITPIYGHGANDSGCERKDHEESSSSLKLPPRPHGVRIESMRQRMRTSRAMNGGFLNEMPSGIHTESGVDHGQGIHRVVSRLRLRTRNFAQVRVPNRGPRPRLINTESSQDQEPEPMRQSTNTENTQVQDSDGGSRLSSFLRERVDFWQQIARNHLRGYDQLSSISANLANVERIISRLARETSNNSLFGSSANPGNLEQPPNLETHANGSASRPGSVDSVIGVLEGNGLGENQSEVNSTGNSLARRRLRSAASGSSDMHGDASCGRKRRLN